jgi:hypothetical protein
VSDSQGRRRYTRSEVPGSIETRNKIPECLAPLVEPDKDEDGFVQLGWEETRKGGTFGGARLTIETNALPVRAQNHFLFKADLHRGRIIQESPSTSLILWKFNNT